MTGHKRLKTKVRSRKVFAKCVPQGHGKPAKEADKQKKTHSTSPFLLRRFIDQGGKFLSPIPRLAVHRSSGKNGHQQKHKNPNAGYREKGPNVKNTGAKNRKSNGPKNSTNKKSVDAPNSQDIPIKTQNSQAGYRKKKPNTGGTCAAMSWKG